MHMVDIDNSTPQPVKTADIVNDVSQTCWETNVWGLGNDQWPTPP